jgi:hypothetical protein
MKNRMELIMTRKSYLVGHGPHSLENFIRTIKFGSEFLTMLNFE